MRDASDGGRGPDGGWMSRAVLAWVEMRSGGRQAWAPWVGVGATATLVGASLGALFARGEAAQEEACAAQQHDADMTASDVAEYCAMRRGTAPVLSYSGILEPERWVFVSLGMLMLIAWTLTYLVVHASLQRLADAAWEKGGGSQAEDGVGGGRGGDGGRGVGGGKEVLGGEEGGGEEGQGGIGSEAGGGRSVKGVLVDAADAGGGRPAIWQLAWMEPMVCVLVVLMMIVLWVSLGVNYAIHVCAAVAFFLLALYLVHMIQGAQSAIMDMAAGEGVGGGAEGRAWPSEEFRASRNFKAVVLTVLIVVSVPTAMAAFLMFLEVIPGFEHILGPMQYSWILTLTLGSGSSAAEIRDAALLGRKGEVESAAPSSAGDDHV